MSLIRRKQTKNAFLTTRVPMEVRKQFHKATKAFGGAGVVQRELIMAFIEGRVKIAPPALPTEGTIYHVD
jgi:hypothetical protein